MKTINITMGNDHRLRVEMTRWDAPMALLHSSDVQVYALRSYGSRVALVRHFSSQDEGVLEAFWPSNLVQGMYGMEITGIIENEGRWRMLAENAVCVTAGTEKGAEELKMEADSYDVKATITVCEGTKGVDQELRDEIADMIEEEYNASERVREENEFERQQNEQGRIDAEALRVQAEEAREQEMQQAVDNAKPDYVGDDNYVYHWNSTTHQYEKTDTYVKGDQGDPGTTDYNQLRNKPDLSIYMEKVTEAVLDEIFPLNS